MLCKNSKVNDIEDRVLWGKNRDNKPKETILMWFLWANKNPKYQINIHE